MDARMAAVTACSALAFSCMPAHAARAAGIDSLDVAADTDTTLALGLDIETLGALDDLLLDPVRLVQADLDRLGALPWLDAADLAALAAALPVRSADELRSRAGWSEDDVQHTLPFVQFAAAPRTSELALRTDMRRSDLRLQSRGIRITTRFDAERPEAWPAGSMALRHGDVTVAAGDLRVGFGQGMLVWTSSLAPDVGGAPVRAAPAIATAATRSSLRGGGLEWRHRTLQLTFAGGRRRDDSRAATVSLRAGSSRDAASFVFASAGTRSGASVGWTHRRGAMRLAAEAVCTGPRGGGGAAIGFESPAGPARLAIRLQASEGPLLATAGVEPNAERTRAALVRVETAHLRLEALDARARRAGGARTARTAFALGAGGRLRDARFGFDLTYRTRETVTLAAGGETQRTVTSLGALAWLRRAYASGWTVGGEARARGAPVRPDRAWQISAQRRAAWGRLCASLASFACERRWTLPVAGASWHPVPVRGDGLRAAVATEWVWRTVRATGVVASTWAHDRGLGLDAGVAIALRWPR